MILLYYFFFFNDTATTEIYTLSLHDALPILRSPMLTKFVSGRIVKGSRPLKRVYGSGVVGVRGDNSRTASARALICAGVVPQHPPTILSHPLAANSPRSAVMISGVSSKPPKAFGNPAFG